MIYRLTVETFILFGGVLTEVKGAPCVVSHLVWLGRVPVMVDVADGRDFVVSIK